MELEFSVRVVKWIVRLIVNIKFEGKPVPLLWVVQSLGWDRILVAEPFGGERDGVLQIELVIL